MFTVDLAGIVCLHYNEIHFLHPAEKHGSYWLLNFTLACGTGCDAVERLQYIAHRLNSDAALRNGIDVEAAGQQALLLTGHSDGRQAAQDDTAARDAEKRTTMFLAIGGAAFVIGILAVIVFFLHRRRRKRLNQYRNHLDFSPDGPSPGIEEMGERRRDADDLDNDPLPGAALDFDRSAVQLEDDDENNGEFGALTSKPAAGRGREAPPIPDEGTLDRRGEEERDERPVVGLAVDESDIEIEIVDRPVKDVDLPDI